MGLRDIEVSILGEEGSLNKDWAQHYLVQEALEFAYEAHLGQTRKGTNIPYISHPLEVAQILGNAGCSPEVIAAGLLHDTVEDTPVTLSELTNRFGQETADIVKGCSEPNKSDPWKKRKQHTLEYIVSAPSNIRIVALADKLQNIRSINKDLLQDGEELWQRFNEGKEEQSWYYQGMCSSLKPKDDDVPGYHGVFDEFYGLVYSVF